jgi:hypothetical protein
MRYVAAVVSLSALALAGCSDDSGGYVPLYGTSQVPVQTVGIDTDASLAVDAGKGVGVFVEYGKGGTWHISATCDTLVNTCNTPDGGCACVWDLVASVDLPQTLTVSDQKTEFDAANDSVSQNDAGSVRVIFGDNADNIDGVKLAAPAGATLTLDVFLDGMHDVDLDGTFYGSYIQWVSGGAANAGAPSDPVAFAPSTP